jgi:hypothetical protein
LENDPTRSLPRVHTHTKYSGYMRIAVTAYTDKFPDSDENSSHIAAVKKSVQSCLFARCCDCEERQRATCDGVIDSEFWVETVPPHVRDPLDPSKNPVRIVAQATVFTTKDFDPSHTPCMGGK